MNAPQLRQAAPSDLPTVERLLAAAELPTDDVAKHLHDFIIAESEGEVVGAIGFEVYADAALLRSAVVAPVWQGRGVGRALVERLVGEAAAREIDALFLLTSTAHRYFASFGFEPVRREDIPTLVKTSVEFRGACPESAMAMRLNLRAE